MTAVAWRNNKIFFISLISILSIAIFFDTWRSMVEIWLRSGTYAHGFLIVPISLWLIWTQRENLRNLEPEPAWLALVFVSINGLLWLMADIIDALVVKQFAVVGLLITAIWCYLGHRIVGKLVFPLLFLYFMVPVGEALLPYLMEFTANFAVKLLRLSGVSVYQEGLYFTLTSGHWSVVEACSGIRYLIASVTLGLVYAYINYTHFYKRLIFTIAAIIVPIIANGLRAYMIVMIGHLSDMKLAVGVDHLIYGAIFFGVVILILFYIGSFWKDEPVLALVSENGLNNSISAATFSYNMPCVITVVIAITVSFIVWPTGSNWLKSRYNASLALNTFTAQNVPQPWQKIEKLEWPWKPEPQGVKSEAIDFFSDGERTIAFYQANFGNETQGAELVNSNNNVNRLLKSKWRLVSYKKRSVEQNGGDLRSIDESLIKGVDEHYGKYMLVYSWYQIGNKHTANPYLAKFYQLLKRLTLDTSSEILIMTMLESESDFKINERSGILTMLKFFNSLRQTE